MKFSLNRLVIFNKEEESTTKYNNVLLKFEFDPSLGSPKVLNRHNQIALFIEKDGKELMNFPLAGNIYSLVPVKSSELEDRIQVEFSESPIMMTIKIYESKTPLENIYNLFLSIRDKSFFYLTEHQYHIQVHQRKSTLPPPKPSPKKRKGGKDQLEAANKKRKKNNTFSNSKEEKLPQSISFKGNQSPTSNSTNSSTKKSTHSLTSTKSSKGRSDIEIIKTPLPPFKSFFPSTIVRQLKPTSTIQPTIMDYSSRFNNHSKFNFSDGTLKGFKNLGNTCYLNSVLQSLVSLQPFTKDMVTIFSSHKLEATSFFSALVAIIKEVSCSDQVINLKKIKDAVAQNSKIFAGNAQQDAHEFLCNCLNQIEYDLEKIIQDKNELAKLCPSDTNFTCRVEHKMICENCQTSTSVEEIYHDFSLDLVLEEIQESNLKETPSSIQTLLETFFVPQIIEKTCSDCGNDKAKVEHRIVELPKILILHLKRFKILENSYYKLCNRVNLSKLIDLNFCCNSKVKIPPLFEWKKEKMKHSSSSSTNDSTIQSKSAFDFHDEYEKDLEFAIEQSKQTSYVASSLSQEDRDLQLALQLSMKEQGLKNGEVLSQTEERIEIGQRDIVNNLFTNDSSTKNSKLTPTTYHLQSIVHHIGTYSSAGHYVADVFDPSTNTWKNFDDFIVRDQTESQVFSRQCPYILFYVSNSCWISK